MTQQAALTLNNLSCDFKTQSGWFKPARFVRAVDGISLTLEQGGVLGVVGESGCGKTTLARMILGLQKPTTGEAFVQGQRLSELDRRARARQYFRAMSEVQGRAFHGRWWRWPTAKRVVRA